MKMTSAENELYHHENLQPAIYNGHFCPTSNIQGRGVCQEQHRHGQKTQALPRAPSLALLRHGPSNYQEGEKAGLLTIPSRNENIVVGLNFSVWM